MKGFQWAWPESTVEWRGMSEGVHYSQQVARFYWTGRHGIDFRFETDTQWKTNERDVPGVGHLIVCIPKGFVTVRVAKVIK